MVKSLSNIPNPILRSLTAASTTLSIVTLISAVAIGFSSKPKNKANHQIGVYASLLAFVAGAGLGLAVSPSNRSEANTNYSIWDDWREFKIIRKVPESKEITSFYFQPLDGQPLPDFEPGQYLTIKLDIPGQSRPVIRTYSLSDFPQQHEYYRLSIKREGSPRELDVPPGTASNFMHDQIEAGSIILCKPPKGKFYLDVDNPIPAVLISNGVGITPMIAMAKACANQNPQRHIWFIHGARNGEHHAFQEEINALQIAAPNLHIHYRYSRPRPEDEGCFHSQGYADPQLLADTIIPEIQKTHQGTAEAEYYLCGSPAFMDSLKSGLAELGIEEEKVYFESFGGGKTKGKKPKSSTTDSLSSAEVVFAQSNQTVTWTGESGTLLELAEAHGLNPDYSCRQGVCHTCTCALTEGEVEYLETPSGDPEAGSVLICVARPKTAKVVLDL